VRVEDDEPAAADHDLGQHAVTVLSSSMLKAARCAGQESQADLATRAGVPVGVVKGIEDGTRAAWALPYSEFAALVDAVAARCPGSAFETAAACDLLLSCVLDGDRVFATDVLAEPGSQELAIALVRLAVTGELDSELPGLGDLRLPEHLAVLRGPQVVLLRDRAAALAASGSPDAWVGVEILAACRGVLS